MPWRKLLHFGLVSWVGGRFPFVVKLNCLTCFFVRTFFCCMISAFTVNGVLSAQSPGPVQDYGILLFANTLMMT
jgi:hypothetical protein